MTPALTNSSRSTCGTTRTTAYSNALRSGTLRLLKEDGHGLDAGPEPGHVAGAAGVVVGEAVALVEQARRELRHHALDDVAAERLAQVGGRLAERARPGQEHVLLHHGEGILAAVEHV